MEEIEIQCVYLRRRENQPDEYDRRIVKCTRRERILQFRSKVAEAFQISPTSIKLINRGKLVELNPILSLIDVEIDQSSTIHVLDLSQKAPSMSRRRPQSAATPFLPHSSPEMPNVIRMANARSTTLTELSVNRYCMHFVYTEALCPQEQLDTTIRSLAESFRNKYSVDVDVQRRNGQPFEGDITFDVAFRAPAIMPSGAYNRYEAIKTLLIRQKLFITVVEKHLIDKIQNPQENSVPLNFDEIVLQEMDRVETMELFCNNDYFSDDVSNAMMNEFVSSLESEVNDEVPLLGNVLQIRHLVPTDYYNILDMSAKLDQEAYKLTNLQRTLFNTDQTVDPKIADLFTVLLRRIHHLQAHIQHIFSEISLRTNDSLRVAYPQGVLSTFSGLNPDITLTITFMTTTHENRNVTNEMNSGRFTSFHQVHVARPVIRANIAMEVEMGTVNPNNNGRINGNRPRPIPRPRPPNARAPNATPYARPRNVIPLPFMNRPTPFNRPPTIPPYRLPPISPILNPQSPQPRFVQRVPVQLPRASSPTGGAGQQSRSLREFLSALQSSQIEIGTQNGNPVTMSSNDAVNPLNSIFRAVDSNDTSNDNNAMEEEDGESDGTAIIIGTSPDDSDDGTSPEDFARALQAAMASQRGSLNEHFGNANGPMPPNVQSRSVSIGPGGPRMVMHNHHQQQHMHGHGHEHHPHMHGPGHHPHMHEPGHHHMGGIPVQVQRLQQQQGDHVVQQLQRQMRNLGPNGGCPLAYYERLVPENLENHATAQEISVAIPEMDLIPCIQRYPFDRSVMRRNMNEFVATSVEGLKLILKAYMQGIVSFNTGRQIAHPAITNELMTQGHRIQVRRPPYHDRVIEFYRLMGSQDLAFLVNIFETSTFLEDRGFLGNIVLTILNSIQFETIPHLILNPFNLGVLRSSIKNYIIEKFHSDDVDKILADVKEKLFDNFYHYLLNVTPFSLVRDNKNMVGTLQRMDAEMLANFYKIVFDKSSDEEFGKYFMNLLRTYHSSLISFCYIASDGFPHAYREFLRMIFLDFPQTTVQQTDFAIDVFMESLVNLGLSFEIAENLSSINTENISKYILANNERFTPEPTSASIGAFGHVFPPTRVENIDTTYRAPLLPTELLEDDLE